VTIAKKFWKKEEGKGGREVKVKSPSGPTTVQHSDGWLSSSGPFNRTIQTISFTSHATL